MKDPKRAAAIREYQKYRAEIRSKNKRQRSFKAQEQANDGTSAMLVGERARQGRSTPEGDLRLNVSSCLTKNEAEIFGVMLEAVHMSNAGTVVRVAGGWVRDKLLGLQVKSKTTLESV